MIKQEWFEEVECVTCGKLFPRFTSVRGSGRAKNIRRSNSINCSPKCSRKWEKGANKRAYLELKSAKCGSTSSSPTNESANKQETNNGN